ncbi:MAG: hypothetical protein PVG32_13020, partial [Anaerolineales bacterium]
RPNSSQAVPLKRFYAALLWGAAPPPNGNAFPNGQPPTSSLHSVIAFSGKNESIRFLRFERFTPTNDAGNQRMVLQPLPDWLDTFCMPVSSKKACNLFLRKRVSEGKGNSFGCGSYPRLQSAWDKSTPWEAPCDS